ncbi:hypothetical protein GOEFS_064_00360 [Gordonia effusa NBRC 100432]|uniref:Uncharacterized protein n=1 Tax=Gordonia effusa NBRC 100432 TaxID=1077974 RepID=H0R146_9ACTN|nr:hypothetical protein GOEFS_064_00360 [Gordonia effusa NBRC 100432]
MASCAGAAAGVVDDGAGAGAGAGADGDAGAGAGAGAADPTPRLVTARTPLTPTAATISPALRPNPRVPVFLIATFSLSQLPTRVFYTPDVEFWGCHAVTDGISVIFVITVTRRSSRQIHENGA